MLGKCWSLFSLNLQLILLLVPQEHCKLIWTHILILSAERHSGKHISLRHQKLHVRLSCVVRQINRIFHSATRDDVCICFASYHFRSKNKFCRTVRFSLKIPENLVLMGCCTNWQGDPFQMFWRSILRSPTRNYIFFWYFNPSRWR